MKSGASSIPDSAWVVVSVIVAAVVGYTYVNMAGMGLKPTIALCLFVFFAIGVSAQGGAKHREEGHHEAR